MMQPSRILPFCFVIFFCFRITAQQPIRNYEKEWKQIDALVKKELPKSALKQVKKVYQLAKNEKQEAQMKESLNKAQYRWRHTQRAVQR